MNYVFLSPKVKLKKIYLNLLSLESIMKQRLIDKEAPLVADSPQWNSTNKQNPIV